MPIDESIIATAVAALMATGVAIVHDVLSKDQAAVALDRLWAASNESERRGVPAHVAALDPNASNVRVFNLIDLDPIFGELIANPTVDAIVGGMLGRDYIVSNFSANIARPGSESMVVHSDLAAVMPDPWIAPLSVNAIWCLTDVHAANGATLYLPGSHEYRTLQDVPPDAVTRMIPFEAPAGSVILMEGRIWHTSGRNITENEERALLFGYYTKPFLRPQSNFTRALRAEVQDTMAPVMRYRLGLDAQTTMPNAAIFGNLAGRTGEASTT